MVFKPYGSMIHNATCYKFNLFAFLHASLPSPFRKGPMALHGIFFSNVCTRNAPKNYDQTGLLAEMRRQTPHCRGQSVKCVYSICAVYLFNRLHQLHTLHVHVEAVHPPWRNCCYVDLRYQQKRSQNWDATNSQLATSEFVFREYSS